MVELDRGDMEQFINFHTGYDEKNEGRAWVTFVSWDKLSLVFIVISLLSALGALFVFLTPLLDFILDFMGLHFGVWNEWKDWILGADRGLIIAVALSLNAVVFALLARFRVRRNWSVYAEAGCPQCHEHELTRVRRNRRDRVLSFLGLPVRRYSCRNCTWHGVRLAGYRYPKRAEKIEKLEVDGLESQGESFEEAINAVELPTASAVVAEMNETDVSVNEPKALEIEELEVDKFEAGTIESQSEPFEKAVVSAELLMASTLAAEIKVTEVGVEDPVAIDTVELTEQPFEFNESAPNENSVNDVEFAALVLADEINVDTEIDDEPSSGEVEFDALPELGGEYDEVQPDPQEEMANNGVDSEIIDEDDEFARLCLEVAQSK